MHEQMLVELIHTSHLYEKVLASLFKEYDLTNPQYNILRILKGVHPEYLHPGEIKNRMMFQKSDLTRLIDRLVGKGLVSRKICDSNRRMVDMKITENGIETLEAIYPKLSKITNNFYSDTFTEMEVTEITNYLNKIKTVLS